MGERTHALDGINNPHGHDRTPWSRSGSGGGWTPTDWSDWGPEWRSLLQRAEGEMDLCAAMGVDPAMVCAAWEAADIDPDGLRIHKSVGYDGRTRWNINGWRGDEIAWVFIPERIVIVEKPTPYHVALLHALGVDGLWRWGKGFPRQVDLTSYYWWNPAAFYA